MRFDFTLIWGGGTVKAEPHAIRAAMLLLINKLLMMTSGLLINRELAAQRDYLVFNIVNNLLGIARIK